MTRPPRWVGRTFAFDFPDDHFPALVDRLRAVPDTLAALTRPVPDDVRRTRVDGAWSIQEHAGHLLDLETLFDGRMDDFDAGRDTLRAADMTNRATEDAHHNDHALEDILARFETARAALDKAAELAPGTPDLAMAEAGYLTLVGRPAVAS